MRVVINEAQIKRFRTISQILFFISLGGMGIGFFYTWTNPETSSTVSCLILPVLFIMTLSSVRLANVWIREPRPIAVLSEALKGLGQKYTIFHYLLPAQHVLIGPEGIFTIRTVWQDRSYRVEGGKWYGDQGLIRKLNGYMRQDLIGNPFVEAQHEAQQVQRLLQKLGSDTDIEVQPLIVFINPAAEAEIADPVYPVLFADAKKSPSLKDYLRDQKDVQRPPLDDEVLDALDRMYGLMTQSEYDAIETGDLLYDSNTESYYAATDLDELNSTGSAQEASAQAAKSEASLDPDAPTGIVYVVQDGQLYYIGATTGDLDSAVDELRSEANQEIELIHSVSTAHPERLAAQFHKRFERKQQKGHWYGLSKKDISWLKSRKGN